jgi:predicted PurR-regulated permease PerM
VQGLLTGLTLAVFGVPDPVFWGAIAFFLAFLPVLGTPLVWGPAALYQFSQGATGQGVGILLVGAIVVMNVDNLLRIVLARRIGDIHPLVTLAGVTLGIGIFGILGLVIGPLLLSYLGVLLQVFAQENRRNQRKSATQALADAMARRLRPETLTPDTGLAVPVLPAG